MAFPADRYSLVVPGTLVHRRPVVWAFEYVVADVEVAIDAGLGVDTALDANEARIANHDALRVVVRAPQVLPLTVTCSR